MSAEFSPFTSSISSIVCGICLDEVLPGSCASVCKENHLFCKGCLRGFLESNIKEGTLDLLCCPEPTCPSRELMKKEIHLNAIKDLVSLDSFDRYEQIQLNRTLDAMPDVMWCPTKSCGLPVIVSLRKKQGKCSGCGFCFCIKCKQISHFGECNLPVKETPFQEEMRNWLKNNTKQCPNCYIYIEKNGGCPNMYCTRCQNSFRWDMTSFSEKRPYQVDPKTKVIQKQETPTLRLKLGKNPNIIRCPNCKGQVEKTCSSNHLFCLHCKTAVCFECRRSATSTLHYRAPNKCHQHSAFHKFIPPGPSRGNEKTLS